MDHSAEKAQIENAVRTAAIVAAKGVPLSEAYLSSIVAATSDPTLSTADRLQRATSMAEQYATAPKPLNMFSASPQEIAAQASANMQFASSRVGGASARCGEASSGSGKAGYGSLAASDARALQAVTSANFKGSAFEGAGLDYATLSYLRTQDRTFTAQNVLNAANDAKALGFSPRDRAAMVDHTTIDRYDPKARITNKALQDYQAKLEEDDTLADLHNQERDAKTSEEKKAVHAEAAKRRDELAKESGLKARIEDKGNHPKSKAATQRRKTAMEKRAESNYEKRADAKSVAQPPKLAESKAGADLFKKLKASPQ